MAKYLIISCHVLWRELCFYSSVSKNIFDFIFLNQGLHNTPDLLRREVQKAIDEAVFASAPQDGRAESSSSSSMDEATPAKKLTGNSSSINVRLKKEYDAILLGYGLCSNGIQGIMARDRRLVVMRGHDCLTFLLGSKERYSDYFKAHPGTYWYSPGWIDSIEGPGRSSYERTLQRYIKKYGRENADFLMKMEQNWYHEYSNAAYVDMGFGDTAHYKEHTRECAQWLGWNYDELKGDPKLIQDFLEGNWDEDRFLVVPPGQTISASNDERVLCTV